MSAIIERGPCCQEKEGCQSAKSVKSEGTHRCEVGCSAVVEVTFSPWSPLGEEENLLRLEEPWLFPAGVAEGAFGGIIASALIPRWR